MKKATPSVFEQQCPACGGLFTISSASRKKRVQCPRCREVVTLGEPADVAPATVPDAPPEWAARCDQLQTRIEALEQQVEALAVAPRPHAALLADSSPMSREQLLAGDAAPERTVRAPVGDDAAQPVFRPERRTGDPLREIALIVAAGDDTGRAIAENLRDILARVGWEVSAIRTTDGKGQKRAGLVLAAGPAVPTGRITGTMQALREAGLSMSFQLDPERGDGDAVMIIGAGVAAEKDSSSKK
ncbi:MAG: hypothetical protein K8R23_11685 [Chthoniobacter sp.]|nr:hypothetical protein [Chthoniobacter sp.]